MWSPTAVRSSATGIAASTPAPAAASASSTARITAGLRAGRSAPPRGADLRAELRGGPAAAPADAPLAFAHGLIAHAHEQRRLFRAIVGKRSGHVVQQRFREMVTELVREDLAALGAAGARRDAAARFLAGGLLELLTFWLDARSPMSPEELEALLRELAGPILARLRAR
ncbi:MAG TPA: TetR/AcrR family transcriptional regulator C-terminal domain-containing protein [Polyangia bacterium]|jgi:hypothetical protein